MADSKETPEEEVVEPTEEVVTETTEEVVEDLDYFKNKFLRAQADVQNMRRRMATETEERVRLRLEGILSDLMSVADYLDAGLKSVPQSIKVAEQGEAFLSGMTAIQQALDMVFISHGVSFISPQSNDSFDPDKHEAIETATNTELENDEIELLSRGYSIGSKILRPAKVRVISKSNSEE
ncbi:MAG: nucleotide exchange factor GrpE [Planctomycetota bacterium]|nr:nucleotide exchange factor GrpE [Planctomycetota bacterium]